MNSLILPNIIKIYCVHHRIKLFDDYVSSYEDTPDYDV